MAPTEKTFGLEAIQIVSPYELVSITDLQSVVSQMIMQRHILARLFLRPKRIAMLRRLLSQTGSRLFRWNKDKREVSFSKGW